MDLGALIIIGIIVGTAFGIYMEVDKYRSIKMQNPGASKKQVFGQYVNETIEDGERRKMERYERAQRRNERYLKQLKMEMTLNGDKIYHEDGEQICFMDREGNSYSFDKQSHYVMKEY